MSKRLRKLARRRWRAIDSRDQDIAILALTLAPSRVVENAGRPLSPQALEALTAAWHVLQTSRTEEQRPANLYPFANTLETK